MNDLKRMHAELSEVLAQTEQLHNAFVVRALTKKLGEQIGVELRHKDPIAMVLMKGGMFFAADLLRSIDLVLEMQVLTLGRYGDATTGGRIHIEGTKIDVKDRNVLLIDDIFDKGITLGVATDICLQAGAQRVYSAVLCTKETEHEEIRMPTWSALTVPDRFVFGSGMDYKGYFRNLQGIFALPEGWKD